ncbi:hypothetical protein J3R30DRAFT_110851 [Lentinula aciculospora]|uniref:Uncharacterized protein n=1 Tax=Lentinula aciculospora TaxID=153920 RepID=A0A9W9AUH1_9AGAR|nr:hypothetical protein J3R30DRAFT_110851 [Lentinula aciculospora]
MSQSERPARLDIQQKARRKSRREEAEGDEDGQPEQGSEEEDVEVESPDSYVGSQSAGWNRSGHYWQLNPASSTSPNLTPTVRGRTKLQQHRPTRSRSAPPTQMTFSEPPSKPLTAAPDETTFDFHRSRRYTSGSTYTSGTDSSHSSPSNSFSSPPSSYGYGYGKSKNGDLLRPPPPLHRPTTFWRRTPRSGVTASSYSPSSHLIRRSTFIAAGLPFERPMADISALGVESRVKAQFDEDNARAKVSEVFWEVVVQR